MGLEKEIPCHNRDFKVLVCRVCYFLPRNYSRNWGVLSLGGVSRMVGLSSQSKHNSSVI